MPEIGRTNNQGLILTATMDAIARRGLKLSLDIYAPDESAASS